MNELAETTKTTLKTFLTTDIVLQKAEQTPRLMDLNDTEFETQLKLIIVNSCVAHGIKNLPSQEEKLMIFDIIRNTPKYRLLTIEQIKMAFQMNVTADEPIGHFQLFSVEFMCKVLNAFLKRVEQFKIETKSTIVNDKPKITEEELEKINRRHLETIINDFNKFCQKPTCIIIDAAGKYLTLERKELIKEPDEEKQKTLEQARLLYLHEVKSEQVRRSDAVRELIVQLEKGLMPKNELGAIKNIAREITLRKWFEVWKESGFDLSKELLTVQI